MENKGITIRLSPELHEHVKAHCTANHITIKAFAIEALAIQSRWGQLKYVTEIKEVLTLLVDPTKKTIREGDGVKPRKGEVSIKATPALPYHQDHVKDQIFAIATKVKEQNLEANASS